VVTAPFCCFYSPFLLPWIGGSPAPLVTEPGRAGPLGLLSPSGTQTDLENPEQTSLAAEAHDRGPLLEGPNRGKETASKEAPRGPKKLRENEGTPPASGSAAALTRVGRARRVGGTPSPCEERRSAASAANSNGRGRRYGSWHGWASRQGRARHLAIYEVVALWTHPGAAVVSTRRRAAAARDVETQTESMYVHAAVQVPACGEYRRAAWIPPGPSASRWAIC